MPPAVPPSFGPSPDTPTGHGDQYTVTTPPGEKVIPRDPPEPDERRKHLVTSFTDMIKHAKTHWDPVFRKMERDQKFAAGSQWPEDPKRTAYSDESDDDLYVANITLQHIQKRVAALYAKNPRSVAKKRPRLLATTWDGSLESLAQAEATVQQAQAALMGMPSGMPAMPPGAAAGAPGGMPQPPAGSPPPGVAPGGPPPGPEGMPMMPAPPPPMPPPEEMMNAQAVLADAQSVKQQIAQLNKIAKTLEILYAYEISEQQQNFKSMMKMTVRRAATAGVGWTRLGFQRIMGPSPDRDSRLADMQHQLDLVERIAADMADDEVDRDSATAEELRLTMQAISEEGDTILREGLLFTWPKSTAIIPDPRCTQLRDFLGCDWAAEEYILSVNEIKETYHVDVGRNHVTYNRNDIGTDYERARASWQANTSSSSSSDDPHVDVGRRRQLYRLGAVQQARRPGLRHLRRLSGLPQGAGGTRRLHRPLLAVVPDRLQRGRRQGLSAQRRAVDPADAARTEPCSARSARAPLRQPPGLSPMPKARFPRKTWRSSEPTRSMPCWRSPGCSRGSRSPRCCRPCRACRSIRISTK